MDWLSRVGLGKLYKMSEKGWNEKMGWENKHSKWKGGMLVKVVSALRGEGVEL